MYELYLKPEDFCIDIFDIGGIATIKHRCVTHLYCCNAIQQVKVFMHK